jgi:hypothetical protein
MLKSTKHYAETQSNTVFIEVRVAQYLVFRVVVGSSLIVLSSIDYCIACPSSIRVF